MRPYKKRAGQGVGAPPVRLPTGEVEHEVDEIIGHHYDAHNVRGCQVKWLNNGDVTWAPEAHVSHCADKVHAYLNRHGIAATKPRRCKRPPKAPKQGDAEVREPTLEESLAKRKMSAPVNSGNLRRFAQIKQLMHLKAVPQVKDPTYAVMFPWLY